MDAKEPIINACYKCSFTRAVRLNLHEKVVKVRRVLQISRWKRKESLGRLEELINAPKLIDRSTRACNSGCWRPFLSSDWGTRPRASDLKTKLRRTDPSKRQSIQVSQWGLWRNERATIWRVHLWSTPEKVWATYARALRWWRGDKIPHRSGSDEAINRGGA